MYPSRAIPVLASSSLLHSSVSSFPAHISTRQGISPSFLSEQKAWIRNLHQYPTARHKSLVKDRHRFARNWWLNMGNNYELVDEVGHEREALENFGEYSQDSEKDRYIFSTNRLEDLPPKERLSAITGIMRKRWKVQDSNRGYDKAKLLLQALECFSELRLSGNIKVFDELPEPDQDTFLQYVEGCSQFAQASAHSHPHSVAILIRCAQICDEMRCSDKRDDIVHVAELTAKRMDRAYSFNRPTESISLTPPSITENETNFRYKLKQDLEERFRDKPWVLEKPKKLKWLPIHQNKKQYLHEMRKNDKRLDFLKLPSRPEIEKWNSS